MEEKKVESQPLQGASYILMPCEAQEDEIDLIDLWRVLMRRKAVIFFIAIIALMVSVGYAIVVGPIPRFRAQVVILPPLADSLEGLLGVNSPNELFTAFVQNLQSKNMQNDFFSSHTFSSKHNRFGIIVRSMPPSLSIPSYLNMNRGSYSILESASINIEGNNKSAIVKILNDYIRNVEEKTKDQAVESVIEIKRQEAIDRISKLRSDAFEKMDVDLARLEEAILIAKKLNIHNIVSGNPLYMRGTKALGIEIKLLRSRKNEDKYIAGLHVEKMYLSELNSISKDVSRVSVMRFSDPVLTRRLPSKHRYIIIKGLLGGLLLGVFAAFLFEFILRMRKEKKEPT